MKNIKIKVNYVANICAMLGRNGDEFVFERAIKVEDLLNHIIYKYGKKSESLFFDIDMDTNRKKLSLLVTRNNMLADKEDNLNDGDMVMLIPVMAGG